MWSKLAAVAFMLGIDGLILAVLRSYNQTGTIFAFPFGISRDRSPRRFRFTMAIGWLSLALSIAFTAVISTALLLGH